MYMEKQEKVALFPHRLTVLLLELVNLLLPPKGDFWQELLYIGRLKYIAFLGKLLYDLYLLTPMR